MATAVAPARPGRHAPDRRALSPESTVAEASLELLRRRESAAIVFDGGQPVGVITLDALSGHDAARAPAPQALLADVMALECVAVDPASGVTDTLRIYTQAAWDSLRRRHPRAAEILTRRAKTFRPADGASTWFG